MFRQFLLALLGLSVLACGVGPVAAQKRFSFGDLPRDLQQHVNEVRKTCGEPSVGPKEQLPIRGISEVDLDGDGGRDLMVDNENVCLKYVWGGNCTNRGCDLLFWKQAGPAQWTKVFKEHLYGNKFITFSDDGRFLLIAASVYGGKPECKPVPGKEYTSGEACSVLIRYRDGKWVWEKIE